MIWERALPGPRVVNLRQRKLKNTIGEWEIETAGSWPPLKKELLGEEVDTDEEEDEQDEFDIFDFRDEYIWQGRQRNIVGGRLRANIYDDKAYREAHLVGWVSDCPAPEILSVCREAFEVVSKLYHKVFVSLGADATIWFCFKLDTLYLRYDNFLVDAWDSGMLNMAVEIGDSAFMFLDTEALRRVKSLAILVPEDRDQEWEGMIEDFSTTIGFLEKLYLVVKDYQENCNDGKALVIIEPIDFDATMAVYENVKLDSWQSWQSGALLTPKLIQHRQVEFDMHKIRAMLEDDVEAGGTPWRIPTIEEKAVFTLELVEKMESVRRKSQKYLDDPSECFIADENTREALIRTE